MEEIRFKFRTNEKVLCFHGAVVCEAICAESKYDEQREEILCRVSYKGPGRHWEKWMAESRLMRRNLTNLDKHKRLRITTFKPQNPGPSSVPDHHAEEKDADDLSDEEEEERGALVEEYAVLPPAPSPPPDEDKLDDSEDRFLSADSDSDSEDDDEVLNTINIELPANLIGCLAEDWRVINKEKMLVKLPPPITVHQILQDFLQITEAKEQGEPEDKTLSRRQMAIGVKKYFDIMVGPQLMYRSEEAQYNAVEREHGEDAEMSKIYGAVHFLRLFVRLGWAIGFSKFDETTEEHFMLLLHELLSFIDNKVDEYFTEENYFTP